MIIPLITSSITPTRAKTLTNIEDSMDPLAGKAENISSIASRIFRARVWNKEADIS